MAMGPSRKTEETTKTSLNPLEPAVLSSKDRKGHQDKNRRCWCSKTLKLLSLNCVALALIFCQIYVSTKVFLVGDGEGFLDFAAGMKAESQNEFRAVPENLVHEWQGSTNVHRNNQDEANKENKLPEDTDEEVISRSNDDAAKTIEDKDESPAAGTSTANSTLLPPYSPPTAAEQYFPVPSYLILGAQKSGTTYLSFSMHQHPLVNAQRKKELHFFNRGGNSYKQYATAKHFPFPKLWDKREKHDKTITEKKQKWLQPDGTMPYREAMTYDATSWYLLESNTIIPKIQSVCPWVKMIALLRNPVDRAFSSFVMQRMKFPEEYGNATFASLVEKDMEDLRNAGLLPPLPSDKITMPPDFYGSKEEDEAWNKYLASKKYYTKSIVAHGLYAVQLRQWFRAFPRSQFFIVQYENDVKRNAESLYHNVTNFLGLPPTDFQKTEVTANTGNYKVVGGEDEDSVDKVKSMLAEFYKPHNDQLALLLDDARWRSYNHGK